jgi:hypothetical protein
VVASLGTTDLRIGYLGTTFEVTNPLFTEFGVGPDDLPRVESPMEGVQGRIAVIVDASADAEGAPDDAAVAQLLATAGHEGVTHVLAFENIDELTGRAERYRRAARAAGLTGVTQGLWAVTFSLLTTTSVWHRYRREVRWAVQNRLQPVRQQRTAG